MHRAAGVAVGRSAKARNQLERDRGATPPGSREASTADRRDHTLSQGDGGYSYLDALDIPLIPGAKIQYRLAQQDFDGALSYSPTVRVDYNPAIADTPMLRVFPNPATYHATIAWDVRPHSNVAISVSDQLGRIVWSAVMTANSDRITWDCRRAMERLFLPESISFEYTMVDHERSSE